MLLSTAGSPSPFEPPEYMTPKLSSSYHLLWVLVLGMMESGLVYLMHLGDPTLTF